MTAVSDVLWSCEKHKNDLTDDMRCRHCDEEEKMTNDDKNIYMEPVYIKALDLDTRYTEYLLLCTNGDVTPMPYDVWLEWDEHVYQKHVREAGSVLSPATFQRMQEPESKVRPATLQERESKLDDKQTVLANNRPHEDTLKNVQTMSAILQSLQISEDACDSLRAQLEDKVEQNESLIEDLAKADAALENQKADLWRLIEEARRENQASRNELNGVLTSLQNRETECGEYQQLTNALRAENQLLNQENEELPSDLDKLHEGTPLAVETRTTPANQPLYPHYFREVPTNTTHVDISWVLKSWDVPCCEGHAIKKLMASGKRGAKDRVQDLKEARDSISRAIELEQTK